MIFVTEEVGFPTAENSSVSSLDKHILALFGDADQLTATLGPRIHPDIANRWASLLGQGLPETTLSVLLRKYPSPVNCSLLPGTRFNLEIASAVTA